MAEMSDADYVTIKLKHVDKNRRESWKGEVTVPKNETMEELLKAHMMNEFDWEDDDEMMATLDVATQCTIFEVDKKRVDPSKKNGDLMKNGSKVKMTTEKFKIQAIAVFAPAPMKAMKAMKVPKAMKAMKAMKVPKAMKVMKKKKGGGSFNEYGSEGPSSGVTGHTKFELATKVIEELDMRPHPNAVSFNGFELNELAKCRKKELEMLDQGARRMKAIYTMRIAELEDEIAALKASIT